VSCKSRIVVVGTTADYIEILIEKFGDRVFFLTDFEERAKWQNSHPESSMEILLDLEDHNSVVASLRKAMDEYDFAVSGFACFDCESLVLTAVIAEIFSVSFPSLDTVINCRSKYTFKKIIKDDGILCPEVFLIRNEEEAARSFDKFEGPAIIKPLTGSGSELVFKCEDKESCREACSIIMEKMKDKRGRMYSGNSLLVSNDPHEVFVMEQYIPGDEYSCDFICDDGQLNILRLTKKIINKNATFGTVSAYILPAELPEGVTEKKLRSYLYDIVKSLDEKRIMAMADFKIYKGEIFILELTPRPGGDCLPFLIKESSGFDIFGAALDFAECKPVYPFEIEKWQKVIGLHLLADRNGILKDIDPSVILSDERVIRCNLKHSKGDRIVMPPNDYESRLLGHVFFRPYLDQDLEEQCEDISQKLIFEMELNDERETAAR